jgi:hypothetical protein
LDTVAETFGQRLKARLPVRAQVGEQRLQCLEAMFPLLELFELLSLQPLAPLVGRGKLSIDSSLQLAYVCHGSLVEEW